jgi:hypothetical protein
MDLEKQTRIIPASKNSVAQPTEVSLFDAVRKWTDAEGVNAYYIELDGKRLPPRTDPENCAFGSLQGPIVSIQ